MAFRRSSCLARFFFLLWVFFCTSTALAADQWGFSPPMSDLDINAKSNTTRPSPLTPGMVNPNQNADPSQIGWRIKILEAAVVNEPMVRLGDIAQAYGNPPTGVWEKLSQRQLWSAPTEQGKPMQVNRARLAQALRESLGEIADICLLPSSMAIQSGGSVLREEDLRSLVVKELTPKLQALQGEAEISELRLPPYAFLAHPGQNISLDTGKITPGRLPLRFIVHEVDGKTIRRFTGTAMINLWANVPCAAQAITKGSRVDPEQVTWMRKNLTFVKGDIWDGRGGPWEAQKTISPGQPIMVADLGGLTLIHKGAMINLVYERGAVRLTLKAEALADGGPGATIAVRNLQSKKQVYGEVVNPDTVRIK